MVFQTVEIFRIFQPTWCVKAASKAAEAAALAANWLALNR